MAAPGRRGGRDVASPRVAARVADSRRRILEAARVVVAEQGYAAAQVAVVASVADVATGSVYRHFPSKASLFTEMLRVVCDRELAVVQAIAAERERPGAGPHQRRGGHVRRPGAAGRGAGLRGDRRAHGPRGRPGPAGRPRPAGRRVRRFDRRGRRGGRVRYAGRPVARGRDRWRAAAGGAGRPAGPPHRGPAGPGRDHPGGGRVLPGGRGGLP